MDWMEVAKTFGFTALCVVALAWYVLHMDKQHREDIKQLREEHKAEVKELTKAFNRISDSVQALIDEIRRSS